MTQTSFLPEWRLLSIVHSRFPLLLLSGHYLIFSYIRVLTQFLPRVALYRDVLQYVNGASRLNFLLFLSYSVIFGVYHCWNIASPRGGGKEGWRGEDFTSSEHERRWCHDFWQDSGPISTFFFLLLLKVESGGRMERWRLLALSMIGANLVLEGGSFGGTDTYQPGKVM